MAIDGVFYARIQVLDLARSKRFYGETLGWKIDTDEPGVAGFWFGTGYLVVIEEPAGSGEHRHAGGMNITVKVSNIGAEHAGLAGRGVGVSPIENRPWGQRDFRFSDPDGYLWEYAQHGA